MFVKLFLFPFFFSSLLRDIRSSRNIWTSPISSQSLSPLPSSPPSIPSPGQKQEVIKLPHNPDLKREQQNFPLQPSKPRGHMTSPNPGPKRGPNKTFTIAHFISNSNETITYINFLKISESPCSPNKPEEAHNNTANAAKIIVDGNEKKWSLQGALHETSLQTTTKTRKNHLREK